MGLIPERRFDKDGRSGGIVAPGATSFGVFSDELADKGFLLTTADGQVAGGVGVSAGSVDEDHQVAEAGRAAFTACKAMRPPAPGRFSTVIGA